MDGISNGFSALWYPPHCTKDVGDFVFGHHVVVFVRTVFARKQKAFAAMESLYQDPSGNFIHKHLITW